MVYYFLCFWALQKVNIPFEPFFSQKKERIFRFFPSYSYYKKDRRTFFTKGAASNENENYQIINTRKTATVSRGRRIVT